MRIVVNPKVSRAELRAILDSVPEGECRFLCSPDQVLIFQTRQVLGEVKRPYWADSALTDHVQPAAAMAGIKKRIGWHTFRHSLATLLGQQSENIKVVQELLRHSNSRITQEVYQHAARDDKRNALGRMSGIFVVPSAKSA